MTPEARIKAIRSIQAGEVAAAFYEEYPFEAARLQIIREWTTAKDIEERENLAIELKALDRVVKLLTAAAQNAKAAALDIKQSEQPEDRYAHP